jgi:hypothetical protein
MEHRKQTLTETEPIDVRDNGERQRAPAETKATHASEKDQSQKFFGETNAVRGHAMDETVQSLTEAKAANTTKHQAEVNDQCASRLQSEIDARNQVLEER